MPHPFRLPRHPGLAILLAGLGVAAADMAVATSYFFFTLGVPPANIVKGIAGGWVGREAARAGGGEMVLLGALSHTTIAIAMVAIYWVVARRWTLLTVRPVACGLLYGVITWAVMKFVVVPLSALTPSTAPPSLVWQTLHFCSHLFIVGLPSAFLARALRAPAA